MQNYAIFSIYRAFISIFFNNFASRNRYDYKIKMNKRLFATILTGAITLSGMAQVSKTLSPYSMYGLGTLADQSQGFNRAMGGLSMGLRGGTIVNMLNPASYSAVDSLTMIFDMGVSGQITNFKEGGVSMNRKTAGFDYATALFRVMPKMGVSVGVMPFTNIGYAFNYSERVGETSTSSVMAYEGDGGLSQAYLGIGYQVLKCLSIGANFSYFWGYYDKELVITTSDSYVNTVTKSYEANISSYKIDLGVQFQKPINTNNMLTVGATVGIGHKLGADAKLSTIILNPQTSDSGEENTELKDAFSLPTTFSVGATWAHKKSLTVGADYSLQKWGSLEFPYSNDLNDRYEMSGSALLDRHKVTIGADWIPEPNPMVRRSFLKSIHYKFGASYATPYYNIRGGEKGPSEFSLSAGFAIPIINSWNNRSLLNISAQWVNSQMPNYIKENSFRINIGLTFNERWFAKWKVD